ncbi:hypothetical protein EDB84DRAFT_1558540 [Lactarius hengduanensis]|nr:hypothetical protein EDB84DRAFT_1558540 [Lactarius hengduanensis]
MPSRPPGRGGTRTIGGLPEGSGQEKEWATEWEKRQGDIRGHKSAGFADKITPTEPPDGNNHPLWLAATECERDGKGKKTRKALFTRRTMSTAFQIAVDHAFTSSVAALPMRGVTSLERAHAIPLHFERHAYGVVKYGRIIPYDKLLSSHKKNALRFLTFLQETRALSRPETLTCHPRGGTHLTMKL